mmetsp:Transcript_31291/g.31778  ORF Transcript_31291/g.31778 Transcript_31291/m.31778 type:complete len:393 (+) Transcript_31291:215-1393(+)
MKPSSSPSIPLSSASKLPYVSFFDKYERIFQCDGGSCITEDKDVSMYQYPPSRSDEVTNGQQHNSNQITTTEALHLNVSSSYQGASRKHHQESPPTVVSTVMYKHQASYDNDEDKYDMDERRIQSRTKAAQTEAANNEYFHNRIQQLQALIHNSNDQSQTQTQMALPRISSPDTTTQQQQQQQQRHHHQQQCQCHSPTPIIKSNKTYATRSRKKSKSTPVQYEMCTVVMPSSFRVLKERPQHGRSGKHTDDSESTQSTQSMSESEGDDDLSSLESHVGGGPDEEDTPVVSILRRKVVKFGTNADTTTKANDNDNRGRRVVRFEKDTQFPDPKERPSSTRKHVPRMSKQQKQVYDRMHNNTCYPRRRRSAQHQQQQPNLSSLLIQLFLQHRPL